jgi:hypothetical protein
MKMESSLAMLHRKGSKQVDQFGSDLAVTVRVVGDPFVKTALFQLKRSTGQNCELERRQLEAATTDQDWPSAPLLSQPMNNAALYEWSR